MPTADQSIIGQSATQTATYDSATNFSNTNRLLLGYLSGGNGTLNFNAGAGTLSFGGSPYNSANYVGVDGGTGAINLNAGTLSLTNMASGGGHLHIGANAGVSNGSIIVGGGTLNIGTRMSMGAGYPGSDAANLVGNNGNGNGTLTINSGAVNIGTGTGGDTDRGFLYMKSPTGGTGVATVNLNGGVLSLRQFQVGGGGTSKTVNLNGGTLRARNNTTTFMQGLTAANVQNGGATVDTNGFNITIAQSLVNAGAGGLTKNGTGRLDLSSTTSDFVGNVLVSAGTLRATAGHNDTNNVSAFGQVNATRNVQVNSGATLEFAANDVYGNAAASPTLTTIANGGTISNTGNFFNTLGRLELSNGGTLTAVGGANASFQAYRLLGPISVTGSGLATMSASGSNSGFHLHSSTTFDIADTTASLSPDLHVSAALINQTATQGGAAGSLVKDGIGTVLLTGNNTYTGTTNINQGTLQLNGAHTGGGAYTIASGATFGGTGTTTSLIQGAGFVSPGTSPGIVTVGQIDPSGGMDYGFEFNAPGDPDWANSSASVNDVLRVTAATPFVNGPFDADNTFNIYFNVADLNNGDLFRGGLFTNADADFIADIDDALFNYFVDGDGGGSNAFNGINYYTLDEYAALENSLIAINVTTPGATGNFSGGAEAGRVMQFAVSSALIPEPASYFAWMLFGLACCVFFARRSGKRLATR